MKLDYFIKVYDKMFIPGWQLSDHFVFKVKLKDNEREVIYAEKGIYRDELQMDIKFAMLIGIAKHCAHFLENKNLTK